MHWLAHVLGIDTQQSYFYDFWSGVATQLTAVAVGMAWIHKHNCHAKGCLRIGKHSHDGTPYCTKHRPTREKG